MTKRRKHSEETKAKMSAAKKGKVHSDEAKAKMSAAGKERWAKRKANQQ